MTADIKVRILINNEWKDYMTRFHWRGKRNKIFGPTPTAYRNLNKFDAWKLWDEKETADIARQLH